MLGLLAGAGGIAAGLAAAHGIENAVYSSTAAQASKARELNEDYLTQLQHLAMNDDTWREKYLNELANRDALSRSQDYDKYVRQNSYQWLVEDLRKAGLNPYLALGSVSPSSGAVLSQHSNGYNVASAKQAEKNNQTKMIGNILQVVGSLISASSSQASSIARLATMAMMFA